MRKSARSGFWVLAVAAVSLVIACETGGEAETAAPTPTASQPAAVTEQPTPTATPQPTPTETPVPTPTHTPVSTPTATAAPTPTDTPAPTPRAPTAADFDLQRFTTVVIDTPPDSIRVTIKAQSPDGSGTSISEFAVRSADSALRLLLDISGEGGRVTIEFITVGDRSYLSGVISGEAVDWITAEGSEGADDPFEGGFQEIAAITSPEALGREWEAIAIEPCGDGRTCFELSDPESPDARLLIDTETYYPVTIRDLNTPEGESTDIDIGWNSDVTFNIPEDATEVTSDELGIAFFGLILAIAAISPAADAPVAEATPEPDVEGANRSDPFPFEGAIETASFNIEVREVLTGDAAWVILEEISQFNDEPEEGRAYVLIRVAGMYGGDDETNISRFNFRLTGDSGVARPPALVSLPEPKFPDALTEGSEFESWIAFDVPSDESNRLLVFDPPFLADDSTPRFIALEPGAQVEVDLDALPEPTEVGSLRSSPVPIGGTAINSQWELTAVEFLRGAAALQMLAEASPFIDDPEPGFEYALLRIRARNVGRGSGAVDISSFSLSLTGSENILYDTASVIDSPPTLNFEVYPGGEVEGWATYEIRAVDKGMMVRPRSFGFGADDDVRYIALEAGAGVEPLASPLAEPTDLGAERGNPLQIGEPANVGGLQIEVLEVLRGEAALDLIMEASDFNDPPEEGLEYVLVRIRAKNVGAEDVPLSVGEFDFELIDALDEVQDILFVRTPSPVMDIKLFPGGEHIGWIALQAAEGEQGLALVYDPSFSFNESDKRFFEVS